MALLRIFKNKTPIHELQLEPNQTYLAGRREDCPIRLDPEPGISRDHFTISYAPNGWKVDVLSRFGEFYVAGEKAPSFTTTRSQNFSVPPYDFELEISPEEFAGAGGDEQGSDFADKTMVSALPAMAILKVIDENGRTKQKFRLEGNSWVGGRDVSCALFIDNSKISRKQFEIFRDASGFKIRDLGSANGTTVNNQPISTKDWTLLESGDVIGVVDWTLVFELQDAEFQERLQNVNPELQKPPEQYVYAQPESDTNYGPIPSENPDEWIQPEVQRLLQSGQMYQEINVEQPGIHRPPPAQPFPNAMPPPLHPGAPPEQPPIAKTKKIKPLQIILLLLILGVGVYAYFEYFGKEEVKPAPVAVAGPNKVKSAFDRLSPEDQQLVLRVKDNTAKMLQKQEYDKVLEELNKVKEKIPDYKDPVLEEREIAAKAGLEQQTRQREEEAAEKQRVDNEKKILAKVEECRSKIDPKIVTLESVDTCLSEVATLVPNHPAIEGLHADVDRILTERKIKKEKGDEFASDAKKLFAIYQKAVAVDKPNRPLEAIEAYEKVIKSKHVDPKKLKAKSKTRIDEILSKLAAEQAVYVIEAEQHQKEGRWKQAAIALKKALDVDADNEVVKGQLRYVMYELTKSLQPKYQEAILQESIGEVDGAKVKWKDIIDKSLPTESYFEKSRLKLKKYGDL